YAISKLDSFAHVKLYYFTPEGCDKAARSSRSTEDEGFGLTHTGTNLTTVALKPLSSFKTSPKAIPDSQLNWDQFCLSSSGFLHTIEHRSKWPKHLILAFTSFFYALKNHLVLWEKQGDNEIGKRVVLCYADQIRIEWHYQILCQEEAFNIRIINEELLRRIGDTIWKEKAD
ncbi:hypothetical protein C8J56DRAFT_747729, partial [Mycena floridula]